MVELCKLIWCALFGLFRSRLSLEAEIVVVRHQLNVLRRKSPRRPTYNNVDRLIFAGLYGIAPSVLSALAIVRPETVIRWHRAGLGSYWRWKSKSLLRLLQAYADYCNRNRTHLSLDKDSPASRAIESCGRMSYIDCANLLGGLHHQYVRI